MNALLALLLKDRISQFAYVDRLAGMVRLVKYERSGGVIAIPVAIDAEADLACDDSQQRDMVPDQAYGCMVYFEDRGVVRTTSRTRGVSFTARLRLVCWVNTQKFGSDPTAASKIQAQFLGAIEGGPYNSGPFIGLRHQVEGYPQSGHGIFSAYTYPEASRQYLMPPFDAFAIDIATSVRVKPGCEDDVTVSDDACWSPPTTRRRRNPNEFTCAELQDPDTGLTDAQLGPDCLDCEGTGECPATTVNGETSTTPTIQVLQSGSPVGTFNPATGVLTISPCDEPCEVQIDLSFNGGRVFRGLTLECGLNTYNFAVIDSEGNPVGEWQGLINGGEGAIVIADLPCTPADPVNIRNTADDSTVATVACGGSFVLPQVRVYYEQADGSIIEQVYNVASLGGGGSTQEINLQIGRVAVRRTDGTSVLYYVNPGDQVDLPALLLAYTQADGSAGSASQPITALSSGQLSTGATIPRFRVFLSDGTTLYKTGDITNPDVKLDGVILQNTAALFISHHEDGTTAVAPDATIQRKDSAGADIGSPIAAPSADTTNVTCPDGTANAINSASSNVGSAAVKSNGSANISIADSTITRPDGTTVGLPATVALDVRDYRSGIAYNFGFILASGQTTVHRTGDEGTMRSDGFFSYTRPVYPLRYAELSNFTTLTGNNLHGNTLRFTDRNGNAAATSGNRVVQDHLTGIEWYIPSSLPALGTWNTAIDAAAASTVESSTDWYLPTERILDTITDDSMSSALNYGPFLITTPLWTCATRPDDSTVARVFRPDLGSVFANLVKTNSTTCSYIFCRRFI